MCPSAVNRDRLQKGWFLELGREMPPDYTCHLTPLPSAAGAFLVFKCPATSLRSLHISGIQHRDASNIWRHQGIPRRSSWSALINNWSLSFLCIAQYQKKARSTVVFDTSRTWASWCSFIVSILTILGSKQTYLFPFGFLEPGSGLSQARLCRVRLIIRHHHKMFQNQSCHKMKIMLQGWITHLWNRRIGCSSHQIWFLNSNHHQQQHKKSQTSKHMNIKAPNFYM